MGTSRRTGGDDATRSERAAIPGTHALVPITSLRFAGSPRLAGESIEHARVLAESGELPPILVHRPTMRVIDGAHRVRAALLRGQEEIEVRFFDGDEDAAYVLAVQANVAHGLPLSLADRRAAAARIVLAYPQWSDRAIASVTGLTHKTVGAIRRRSTGAITQLNTRTGLDGRRRPLAAEQGRRAAAEEIRNNPRASLREVAKKAGVSPATVRDVRRRLRDGEDPTLSARPGGPEPAGAGDAAAAPGAEPAGAAPAPASRAPVAVQSLRRDPSFRSVEAGRLLLRLLAVSTIDTRDWDRLIRSVPEHCARTVAEAARECAATWSALADQVDRFGAAP